jgi:aspartyl-tRNA(Asn)/glutamyl-tRNA(Gln) amidotransferase subunit C
MTISRDTIRHIAGLAELAVSDAEAEALAGQLDRIVGFVAQLERADVPADTPLHIAGPDRVALRDDVVAPQALARTPEMLAPDFRQGLYVVPRLAAQESGE